jgi:hypothetical protein
VRVPGAPWACPVADAHDRPGCAEGSSRRGQVSGSASTPVLVRLNAITQSASSSLWWERPECVLERVKGIEPSYEAWEAAVLPLNYTRMASEFTGTTRPRR